MQRFRYYWPEFALIAAVMLTSLLGFWSIYFGPAADPQPHHHLHAVTTLGWTSLMLVQLVLIASRGFARHRSLGLAVLVAGPLLVAFTATLAIHSARKGVASGEGDVMFVQNSMTTVLLGLLIVLAFAKKHRRKLHGSLLLSTLLIFLGIAFFFALIGFAPQFRIEGPETFYRFELAGRAGQILVLLLGFLFFMRDPPNAWPFLVAGSFTITNDAIGALLTGLGLFDPLTRLVASIDKPIAFVAVFALMFALLAATALPAARPRRAARPA